MPSLASPPQPPPWPGRTPSRSSPCASSGRSSAGDAPATEPVVLVQAVALGARGDVEALGPCRLLPQELRDQVGGSGAAGTSLEPILEVDLDRDQLLLLEDQARGFAHRPQALGRMARPMRGVPQPLDLLTPGIRVAIPVRGDVTNQDAATRPDQARHLR